MLNSKLGAFLIVYGPSGLGFIVLTVTCFSARRNLPILWASIVAVILHLASALMVMALVGMGEAWSGQGEEHNLPYTYFWIGTVALALPVFLRFIYFTVCRRGKGSNNERAKS